MLQMNVQKTTLHKTYTSRLKLLHDIVKAPIKIYNDNEVAIKWSQNLTNKGLRHIQMRKNEVRENINVRL